MEQCLYEPVETKDVEILKTKEINKKSSWMPLLRQVVICSCLWNGGFIYGLYAGAPAVVIPQMRKEANSTEAISDEMVSWINSIATFVAIPCYILPIISGRFGRKYPFLGISITSLFGSIVFYFGANANIYLIAVILQAPMFACVCTLTVIILVEYSSPKNRGMFLSLKSASLNWGIWVANAMGTFFNWRCIVILCIICSIYNVLTTLFWCESPPWLAYNGEYEKCERAHRWLKGNDAESEKDLATLISSCKSYREKKAHKKTTQKSILSRSLNTIRERTFYVPLLLSIAVLLLYPMSGKFVCTIYIIDLIKNITLSESTAYRGMLLLDGVTVTGIYISSILAKYIKRRTMLLTGSVGGITVLLILSLYIYLCKQKVITQNPYVSLTLLSLFFLLIAFGPVTLSYSLYGEIMPLRYRTHGMLITGIFMSFMWFITTKTAPKMFKAFELHGAFLFYGLSSTCIIIFLYKFLPETKDKTPQEIEKLFISKANKEETAEFQSLTSSVPLS